MCDPATLMLMAGTALSAGGAISEGNAKRRAAEATADLNEKQAAREIDIAKLNADRDAEEGELLLGKQIALASAQGGSSNAGSNLLIQKQTAGRTELNKQLALTAGRDKATTLRANASQSRASGRSAQVGGYVSAGASLAKGGSRIDFATGKIK